MIVGAGSWGSARGAYVNPYAPFPSVVPGGVSPISPDVAGETSPTATLPITPEKDDLVFAHVTAAGPNGNAVFTPPAGEGFSSLASGWDQTQNDTRAEVFFKRWGEGAVDNLTVAFSSSLPNARLVLSVVRGAKKTEAPAAAVLVGSSLVASTMLIAPTVLCPDLCLLAHFYEASSSTVNVTPASDSIYGGPSYGFTVGQDGAMAADAAPAISGTSPSATATASGATVTNGWTTITIAFAGETSTPVVQSVSAISAEANSPSPTNTIVGTPNAGDIIVAHLANGGPADDLNPNYTPPAGEGWQTDPLLRITTQTNTDSSSEIFWKRWGDGFTDNATVTFTGTGGNARLVLTRIGGCRLAGSPFDAAGIGSRSDDASNDMGVTAPSELVASDSSLVMRFFATSNNDINIELNAPMMESYGGASYAFENGNNGALASSALVFPVTGSAAIRSASSNVKTDNGWVGITVVVSPN